MTGWGGFIFEVLAAVGLILIPGFLVALSLRIRMLRALSLAPLFSTATVSLAAVVLGLLGVPWNLVSFGAVAFVIVLVATVAGRISYRSSVHFPYDAVKAGVAGSVAAGLAGVGLAAVIISTQLVVIFGSPDAISQSYDNIFHLNAVREIADTGDASSLTLNRIVSGSDGMSFYPGAWHDMVSLVFLTLGGTIPQATNAVTVAVCAVGWPLSVLAMAISVRSSSRAFLFSATALSGVLVAFPTLMLKWGILYPNLLGYAILPAAFALLIGLLRTISSGRLVETVSMVLPLVLALAGLGLAHPNSVTSLAVIAVPFSLVVLRRVVAHRRSHLRIGLAAAVLAGCLLSWAVLRPPAEASVWPPKLPSGQAVGEFLTSSYNGSIADIVLTPLVVLGVIMVARGRVHRWIIASWTLTGVLWVVVASLSPGIVRSLLTGPWYNDSYRLAALTAIPTLLLASFGLADLAERMGGAVADRFRPSPRRLLVAVRAMSIAFVVLLAAVAPTMRGVVGSTEREFALTDDSLLLTTDEKRVLERVDEFVSPQEVIAVNPWEGSSLAYALADRDVTQYHTLSATPERYSAIPLRLSDLRTDPGVCETVRAQKVRWYLDFEDTLDIGDWAEDQFEGFKGIKARGIVRSVATSGTVGLYEIVGCGKW
ncbi:DUF6541 family protein [Microbacterium sp. EF45047]|uniref:DUF6541 family protein n=1 Tax=Microbacterium sp. EF45047 TaxID=2809708 RepID=UPI0023495CF2|nr:DUF6541 family protein [Microbacterium sp. EF45047]WCM56346.1 hypothetical protein JRG78_03870 [Microbacterium sp. EF45047]